MTDFLYWDFQLVLDIEYRRSMEGVWFGMSFDPRDFDSTPALLPWVLTFRVVLRPNRMIMIFETRVAWSYRTIYAYLWSFHTVYIYVHRTLVVGISHGTVLILAPHVLQDIEPERMVLIITHVPITVIWRSLSNPYLLLSIFRHIEQPHRFRELIKLN